MNLISDEKSLETTSQISFLIFKALLKFVVVSMTSNFYELFILLQKFHYFYLIAVATAIFHRFFSTPNLRFNPMK